MTEENKERLLRIARESIASAFAGRVPVIDDGGEENNGAFVTLRLNGRLRGCIGFLQGLGPLRMMIADLAREAAFADPRFPPLTESELAECLIEISLLTKPEPIDSPESFMLGRDGICMTLGGRRAVFLPQVADETGWTKEEMLSALSEKAGLPASAWQDSNAEFSTFQAEVFDESML